MIVWSDELNRDKPKSPILQTNSLVNKMFDGLLMSLQVSVHDSHRVDVHESFQDFVED